MTSTSICRKKKILFVSFVVFFVGFFFNYFEESFLGQTLATNLKQIFNKIPYSKGFAKMLLFFFETQVLEAKRKTKDLLAYAFYIRFRNIFFVFSLERTYFVLIFGIFS